MNKDIQSLLKENRVFNPSEDFSKNARIKSLAEYEKLYRQSIDKPEEFFAEQAEQNLSWFKKWDKVMQYDFSKIGKEKAPYVEFFKGAKLNISYNCIDRHIEAGKGEKKALIWQGEQEQEVKSLTYNELKVEVCKFANVLKKHGIKRGSVVTIFLPMILELPIACLACARIGAIHSVVFSAFSPEALASRMKDCKSEMLITADAGFHSGKINLLKEKTDLALESCAANQEGDWRGVKKVLVCNRANQEVKIKAGRDLLLNEELKTVDANCPCEEMDAESPLFTLYTSGSTGKPKGVLHTTAGYLFWTNLTFKYVFDISDRDIFWCTADVGWITGHSYLVYGPLSNGSTNLMFESVPTYPEANRFWKIIEKFKVSIFYTAPTAIRALMRLGESWPNSRDLSSLRLLGTVGEPINPEAWIWYYNTIGKARCPIVDTWWQTETGGIMISTLPGAIPSKPGSAGKPFFGVLPEVRKEDGSPAKPDEGGSLVIKTAWPGMIRGVYGDEKSELVKNVYFSRFPDAYFTGDGCRVDKDGYYWLLGRIDDVINVSAHRFATAEIESALVSHKKVAEAAVVGRPHETKGQGIYCYVTLKQGNEPTDELRKELVNHVRNEISPIATPDFIQFTPALPKTRSGKIMRRILRKIAEGDLDNLGDTSTLADPSVVDALLAGRA
jgi:acetyl-CoA synthetase